MNISSNASAFVPLLKQYKLITKRESDDKYKLIMLSLFKDLLEAEKYIIKVSDYMKISKEYLNDLREQRDNLYKK